MQESSEKENQRKSYLTEKYHLNNEDDGTISFYYEDFKGAFIDFGKPKNIFKLPHYKRAKDDFVKILKLINMSLIMEVLPINLDTIAEDYIRQAIDKIITSALNIFNNMMVDGWEDSLRESKCVNKLKFTELLIVFLDLINCIDLAIQIGLKKLSEIVGDAKIIKVDDTTGFEIKIHMMDSNGNIIEQFDSFDKMIELLMQSIKSGDGPEIRFEEVFIDSDTGNDIDLAKVKPMGNA